MGKKLLMLNSILALILGFTKLIWIKQDCPLLMTRVVSLSMLQILEILRLLDL